MWKTAITTGVCVSATLFVGFVTLGYLQTKDLLPKCFFSSSPAGIGKVQEAKDH